MNTKETKTYRPNLMLYIKLLVLDAELTSQLHVCCSKRILYYRVSDSTDCTKHGCHIISQSIDQSFHKDNLSDSYSAKKPKKP